ncbi:MAG: hypothetical protein QOJ02_3788 [Acidobacteriota bacterium]|jgi:hypothetical protein|nr:hypothetical protein [Acidobacteriota bacterium]
MGTEDLNLVEVLNSAYSRGWTDFKDANLAEDIAIDVADEFTQTWQQKMEEQPSTEEGYNPGLNPAYYLDRLITLQTQQYKDELIKRRKSRKALSKEDLWLWFVEDLLDYAKSHRSPYMAVAILMVLCEYQSLEIHELYGYVAQSRHLTDDSIYRRYKLDKIHPSMTIRYKPFTKLQGAGINERFVKESNIDGYIEWFKFWLEQLTPLYPECFLPDSFDPYDMEKQYIRSYNVTDYPDAVERKRKHIMQCPKCLTKLLRAARFRDWTTSFAPPHINLPGPGPGDGPSDDRTKPREYDPKKVSLVKKILGKRNIRRQRLSLRSLFVGVDNNKLQKIYPNQMIQIHLKDGASAIRVYGKDWRGRLPLDTHLISWDEDLLDEQPVRYITKLRDGRKLEFTLKYQPDMRSAIAEITYVSKQGVLPVGKPEPIWAWQTLAKVAAAVAIGVTFLLLNVYPSRVGNSLATSFQLKTLTNDLANESDAVTTQTDAASSSTSWDIEKALPSKVSKPAVTITQVNDKLENQNEFQSVGGNVSTPRRYSNSQAGAISPKRTSERNASRIAKARRSPDPSYLSVHKIRRSRSIPPESNNPASASQPVTSSDMMSIFGVVTNNRNRYVPYGNISFEIQVANMNRPQPVLGKRFGLSYSNSRGRFRVCNLMVGTYDVTVMSEGYETKKISSLKVWEGMRQPISIKLDFEREGDHRMPHQKSLLQENNMKQSDFLKCSK